MSELEPITPVELVNKYSNVSVSWGGSLLIGPKAGRYANYFTIFAMWGMGLGFIMYIGFMLPRGYYFECFVSVLIYFLVVYHSLSCMFKDPGIIPRPPDYIKKKAEWEVEAKKKREEANERRIEEAKKRAKEYDPEDTPIPMNETISTDPGNPEPIELQKLPREEIMTKTSKPDEESKTPQNAKIEDINANWKEGCWDTLHIETKRYWNTCQVERPPFASHCNTCNQCVANFDHHWGVLNCCVGGRNLHHFILVQFYAGVGAFFALYAIPMYYYEVYKELDGENQQYMHDNWYKIIGWYLWGLTASILTLFGAMCCSCIGLLGYAMSAWTLIEAMMGQNTLLMNPLPLLCSFGLPIFFGTFFMSLFYFFLIMNGSNKKIEASKRKFQKEHKKKYTRREEGVSSKLKRLFLFLYCNEVPKSMLY